MSDLFTTCWCGYEAAGVSDLTSHQLYCDPHNAAPKVIDDQRKRIAELEAQLAAANAEITRTQAILKRLECPKCSYEQEQAYGDTNVTEYVTWYRGECACTQAEITRLREGGNIHNCEAVEAQISELEKDAAMLDWLADHEAVKNINRVNLSIYETAQCIAYERDVDAEPTVEDYRLALRLMIRTAINAEAAEAARGNDD